MTFSNMRTETGGSESYLSPQLTDETTDIAWSLLDGVNGEDFLMPPDTVCPDLWQSSSFASSSSVAAAAAAAEGGRVDDPLLSQTVLDLAPSGYAFSAAGHEFDAESLNTLMKAYKADFVTMDTPYYGSLNTNTIALSSISQPPKKKRSTLKKDVAVAGAKSTGGLGLIPGVAVVAAAAAAMTASASNQPLSFLPPEAGVYSKDNFLFTEPPLSLNYYPSLSTAPPHAQHQQQYQQQQQQQQQQKQHNINITSAGDNNSSSSSSSTLASPLERPSLETTRMNQDNKRQERLIKNRAAALLSRKRKREHLQQLEVHAEQLKMENNLLRTRLQEMEQRLQIAEAERDQAKSQFNQWWQRNWSMGEATPPDDATPPPSTNGIGQNELSLRLVKPKAAGVMLMVLIFSFAIFSLPFFQMHFSKREPGNNNNDRVIKSLVLLPSQLEESASNVSSTTEAPLEAISINKNTNKKRGTDNSRLNRRKFFQKRNIPAEPIKTTSDTIIINEPPEYLLRRWLMANGVDSTKAVTIGNSNRDLLILKQDESAISTAPSPTSSSTLPKETGNDQQGFKSAANLICSNFEQFTAFTIPPSPYGSPPHSDGGGGGGGGAKSGGGEKPKLSLFSPIASKEDYTGGERQYLRIDVLVMGSEMVSVQDHQDQGRKEQTSSR